MAKQPKTARPEIDITPSFPTAYDPFKPWPFTVPVKRRQPYGKPSSKRLSVLLLPGACEYDPAMAEVEEYIRFKTETHHVTVVVPDVYRGVGEIMARRNGLNYLIVNTDRHGSEELPSLIQRSYLIESKTARRRILLECDMVLAISDCPSLPAFKKEIEGWQKLEGLKVKTFKAMYRKVIAEARAKIKKVEDPALSKKRKSKKK